ncbi:MAG: right-handed parallel beta-helix repeat-containing protein [Deltaproteobacteria bacterium]|nr:right-handed parallel beta-helix repeat-containing protein [Deltaproteobacteria bacterium]
MRGLWLALPLAAGCAPDLQVPEGTRISCLETIECPTGSSCRLGRCVPSDANQPPNVVLGNVARALSSVSVPLVVVDAEGDFVQLQIEVTTGGQSQPADAAPLTVPSSPEGLAAVVTWDAAAQLGSSAYRDDVRLRVTPRDTGAGQPVDTDLFAFGNDAPQIASFTVDDNVVTGLALLRFAVADSSSDPVQVTKVELSLSGDFSDAIDIPRTAGLGSNFPGGTLSALASSPSGVDYNLTWDSAALPEARVDRPTARLRLTLTDSFGSPSQPVTAASFALANAKTPPAAVRAILVDHVADGRTELRWTNPADSDFAGVLVLRKAGVVITETPAQGTAYAVGATIGAAEVIGVTLTGALVDLDASSPPYDYAFFAFDTADNYAPGVRVPLVTAAELGWCTDETGWLLVHSPDTGSQQLQLGTTSDQPPLSGTVFPTVADTLGARTALAAGSPVALGTEYVVRVIATNGNGASIGRDRTFWASRRDLVPVGLPPDIQPGGTAVFGFEPDGWAGFDAEVDTSAESGLETWSAAGVSVVGGAAQALIPGAGEYRFRVRPVQAGCPAAPWTVSAPFVLGNFRYVAPGGSGDQSGSDPLNTLPSLTAALAVVAVGTDVRVAEGVYAETVDLAPGVRLLGGYRGDFLLRDPKLYRSWIRPETVAGGYLVGVSAVGAAIDATSVVDGFYVEPAVVAPLATWNTAVEILAGASPTLSNNEIHAGQALSSTVAVSKVTNNGAPKILNNVIDAGSAQFGRTAVMLSWGGRVDVIGNVITSSDTGVYVFDGGDAVLDGNQISVASDASVSGINCDGGTMAIRNNAIAAASTATESYGLYLYQCTDVVIEKNVVSGAASQAGRGVSVRGVGNVTIRNNVIYGGSGGGWHIPVQVVSATPSISNNTLIASLGGGSGRGILLWDQYGPATPVVVNNIFVALVADADGVYEFSASSDPASMHSNLFVGAQSSVYWDADGGGNIVTTAAMESALCASSIPAAGNFVTSLTPAEVFVDPDGPDDDLTTIDDNDWHLRTTDASITRGGRNAGQSLCGGAGTGCPGTGAASCGAVVDDFDGATRVAPYSIGAFAAP